VHGAVIIEENVSKFGVKSETLMPNILANAKRLKSIQLLPLVA
jgi:hypothetical protein